jgi:cell division protein FtsB
MSLDGLRAWIGEVERKLGVRSRVFLVLVAIAIGGAGAAIYLALDARDGVVSEADLQAVQEQVETQASAGEIATEDPEVAVLEAEVEALRGEIEQLRTEEGAPDPEPQAEAEPEQGGAADGGSEKPEGTGLDPEAGSSGGSANGRTAEQLKDSIDDLREDTK